MQIRKGVVVHNFDKSYVAYDTKKSLMHELNETGYLILSLIEKNKKDDEIVAAVMRNFEIEEAQAKRDFAQFVKILISKDLIE